MAGAVLLSSQNGTMPSNLKPKIACKSLSFKTETTMDRYYLISYKTAAVVVEGKVVAMYLTIRASLQCATQSSN